eukprot:scaffold14653_cov66-Phaeocystis_antarctica.AAC.1
MRSGSGEAAHAFVSQTGGAPGSQSSTASGCSQCTRRGSLVASSARVVPERRSRRASAAAQHAALSWSSAWPGLGSGGEGGGEGLPKVVNEQRGGRLLGALQLACQHGARTLASRERVEGRAPQRQRVQPHRTQPTHCRLAAAKLRDDRLVRLPRWHPRRASERRAERRERAALPAARAAEHEHHAPPVVERRHRDSRQRHAGLRLRVLATRGWWRHSPHNPGARKAGLERQLLGNRLVDNREEAAVLARELGRGGERERWRCGWSLHAARVPRQCKL